MSKDFKVIADEKSAAAFVEMIEEHDKRQRIEMYFCFALFVFFAIIAAVSVFRGESHTVLFAAFAAGVLWQLFYSRFDYIKDL